MIKTIKELKQQSAEAIGLFKRDRELIEKMTIFEIVAKYGYSVKYCRNRLYRLGISVKPVFQAKASSRELTDKELELAKKLVLQGTTGKQLALQLGVSQRRGCSVKTQIARQIKKEEELLSQPPQPPKRKNNYHTHYLQSLGRHRGY